MNMFKKPKVQAVPAAPPPPPVPTLDRAAMDEEYSKKVRRRKGHLRNDTGAAAGAQVAARTLLG